MSSVTSEILNVVTRGAMGIGAERSGFHAAEHGLEGEGIHLDVVEDVLSAGERGEVVLDPGEQGIAAEFPGVTPALQADGFGEVEAMFASLARQEGGAAKAVDDAGDASQGQIRIAGGLL